SNPQEVWEFISRWGISTSEDTRSAIAVCLLEHLLDYHFSKYFPQVDHLARKEPLFADTFSRCWKFGVSEKPNNAKRFERLQRFCKRHHPCAFASARRLQIGLTGKWEKKTESAMIDLV